VRPRYRWEDVIQGECGLHLAQDRDQWQVLTVVNSETAVFWKEIVWCGRLLPVFQRNILHPSSGTLP
jgi:hypothetical protein